MKVNEPFNKSKPRTIQENQRQKNHKARDMFTQCKEDAGTRHFYLKSQMGEEDIILTCYLSKKDVISSTY